MSGNRSSSRGTRWGVLPLLALVLLLATRVTGQAPKPGKRVALVMGNGAYRHQAELNSPPVDARAMERRLREIGFDVEPAVDQGRAGMVQAIERFSRKLPGAEVGLLFYSGHGIQVNDQNYLIPVDAQFEDEAQVEFSTIEVQRIVDRLQKHAGVAVVILDACRDNPFVQRLRGGGKSAGTAKGMVVVSASRGDMAILYGTEAGQKALDGGKGEKSPFTQALLEHIGEPGVQLEIALKRVTTKVLQRTGGRQRPTVYSSLQTDLFLGGAEPLSCPAGSRQEGGRCVAQLVIDCPEGTKFEAGRGCVAQLVQLPQVPAIAPAPMPDSADALYAEAQRLLSSKQWDDARRTLEAFVKKHARDKRAARAQLDIGEAFMNQGMYVDAAEAYLRVIDDFPKSREVEAALYKNGETFFALQRCADALVYFRTLLRRYPKSSYKADANEQMKEIVRRQSDRKACTN